MKWLKQAWWLLMSIIETLMSITAVIMSVGAMLRHDQAMFLCLLAASGYFADQSVKTLEKHVDLEKVLNDAR